MNLSVEQLSRYLNPVFIETGSFIGDGVQAALDAGFETIYSIEIDVSLANETHDRFKEHRNVHVICGSSPQMLVGLNPHKPCTFLLDAHFDGGRTGKDDSIPAYPIVEELNAIKDFDEARNSSILIDDFRLIDKNVFLEALRIVHFINPSFRVELIHGAVPYDVVAICE